MAGFVYVMEILKSLISFWYFLGLENPAKIRLQALKNGILLTREK